MCGRVGIFSFSKKNLKHLFRILRSGNAFISLDPLSENEATLPHYMVDKCFDFGVTAILATATSEIEEGDQILRRVHFPSIRVDLLILRNSSKLPVLSYDDRLVYAIQTSGSTGQPKMVHVPRRAIYPNVLDFALV